MSKKPNHTPGPWGIDERWVPNLGKEDWDCNKNQWVVSDKLEYISIVSDTICELRREHPIAQIHCNAGTIDCSESREDCRHDLAVRANAHLISAAPDLYSSLERAVQYFHDNGGHDAYTWLTEMEAALAKAKGES